MTHLTITPTVLISPPFFTCNLCSGEIPTSTSISTRLPIQRHECYIRPDFWYTFDMKTSKIITFISFIIFVLGTVVSYKNALSAQQILIDSGASDNVMKFLLIPLVLAIVILLFWLYLRKKERLSEEVKYARVISVFFLVVSIMLFFLLPQLVFLPVYNLSIISI